MECAYLHQKGRLENVIKEMDRIKLNTQGLAEVTAAFTPPPTAGSASVISRPLKDVRRRKNFSAPMTADQCTLQIWNIKLLPSGRFVLADCCNICIKLLNTQVYTPLFMDITEDRDLLCSIVNDTISLNARDEVAIYTDVFDK